jgi:hypothetical protein
MGMWGRRRARANYRRVVAEVARNAVVGEAESIVAALWVDGLLQAERQAAVARKVGTHMRDTAYAEVAAAQSGGDRQRLEAGYLDLAASQRALGQLNDRYESVRKFTDRERQVWQNAGEARTRQADTDRRRLADAARAAGLEC